VRFAGALFLSISVSALYAQTCPPVNFVQSNLSTGYDRVSVSAVQRQTDGSIALQRYSALSPYRKQNSTANYELTLLSCSPVAGRTFRPPAGFTPLADRANASSQPIAFSDFLGDGTITGLAVVPGGYNSGPAVDSLLIVLFNSDGSIRSNAYYPVSAKPVGLLVADVNRDGKKDVIVVSQGSGSDQGAVSVLLGKGDGTVQSAVKYSAHGAPVSAVAFDFNGDRNLDLAVANSSTGDISILLGRGDGTFAAATNVTTGTAGSSIALGDFNGDGKQDLVVGMNKALAMFLGNGDGTFRSASVIAMGGSPTYLAAADFNKDGKLDLALSTSFSGTVSILLGDGAGKFPAEYDYGAGYEPTGIFAVDLDGDGNLDVAVATGHPDILVPSYYSTTVQVLFGRGDGTLIGAPTFTTGQKLSSITMADFNGDGKPDIAAAAVDIWIMLSTGGGNFRTPLRVPLPAVGNNGTTPSSIAAGDFNGDGKQDLVVGYGFSDAVYVLLGNGDGTFRTPVLYTVGGVVNSVAVADIDRDGKLDIVFAGAGIGTSVKPVAGILPGNGDGTFKVARALPNFGNGPYFVNVGDFNKDGKLDLAIANKGIPGGSDPGGVLVYLGNGDGSFQNPTSLATGVNPNFVTSADVNGDGLPDLLATTRQANSGYQVAVFINSGGGAFRAASYQPTSSLPNWMTVADLDGDGKADLAIARCCGSTDTVVKLGNGDGTFQSDLHLASSVSPVSVIAADVNGDGKPDLILGQGDLPSSNVAVFLTFASAAGAPVTNVNGASFQTGSLAPDSFATAIGAGLATTTQVGTAPFPSNLGGTTVSITDSSGTKRDAAVAYVSPTQVNYIVPKDAALGSATVTITAGDNAIARGSVNIAAVGPGLFLFGGANLVAANVIRIHADNSQTVEDVYAVAGGAIVPAPIDVSQASDQVYLVLYATGLRGHSSATNSVTATVAGASLSVAYAGAQPQFPGVDQINVLLPSSLAGKGDVTIQVTVDGQTANTGHITIK
jgi:uncharacterized protein (TIGR03437 family)